MLDNRISQKFATGATLWATI